MSFINRTARRGLLFGAIFLALGIATQLLLSWAMGPCGTRVDVWTCELCGRSVQEGNGVIHTRDSLSGLHWFRLTTKSVLEPGDPSCAHKWQKEMFLLQVLFAPVVYPLALVASIIFFVMAIALFVMAIASTVCHFLVRCRRGPGGSTQFRGTSIMEAGMSFIKRIARRGLLFGAIFLALGIAVQLLLSWAMVLHSTASAGSTCVLCGRFVREGNGVITMPESLSGLHWFRLTTKRVVEPGDPSCAHKWQKEMRLYQAMRVPVVYPIALVASIIFFVMSIASTVCHLLRNRRHLPILGKIRDTH